MNVFEIFKSISGEVGLFPQGSQAIFIRFSGCNLLCDYCDAKEANKDDYMDLTTPSQILTEVNRLNSSGIKNIVITGGEPFIQPSSDLIQLISLLSKQGYFINIETNGTIPIPIFNCEIRRNKMSIVMDYKFDYYEKMSTLRMLNLTSKDWIKFVIRDKKDMTAAVAIQKSLGNKGCIANFAYSPALQTPSTTKFKSETIKFLSNKIYQKLDEEKLQGVLNIQLHKLIDMP